MHQDRAYRGGEFQFPCTRQQDIGAGVSMYWAEFLYINCPGANLKETEFPKMARILTYAATSLKRLRYRSFDEAIEL